MQVFAKLSKNPRRNGILYVLFTACLAYVWGLVQSHVYGTSCDRTMPPVFDGTELAVLTALFVLPFILAKSQTALSICFVMEVSYLTFVNILAIFTANSENWECYTMGGHTDFGENVFVPLLIGALIIVPIMLMAVTDRLLILFQKFRKISKKSV